MTRMLQRSGLTIRVIGVIRGQFRFGCGSAALCPLADTLPGMLILPVIILPWCASDTNQGQVFKFDSAAKPPVLKNEEISDGQNYQPALRSFDTGHPGKIKFVTTSLRELLQQNPNFTNGQANEIEIHHGAPKYVQERAF